MQEQFYFSRPRRRKDITNNVNRFGLWSQLVFYAKAIAFPLTIVRENRSARNSLRQRLSCHIQGFYRFEVVAAIFTKHTTSLLKISGKSV